MVNGNICVKTVDQDSGNTLFKRHYIQITENNGRPLFTVVEVSVSGDYVYT